MKKSFCLLLLLMSSALLWGQDDIEVINIENRAVQEYMADTERTYAENNDYRVSVITKYNNPEVYGKGLHFPQGKLVTWQMQIPADSLEQILITASEYSNYSDAYTFRPDAATDTSFIIRNLLPDRIYYYKVEAQTVGGRLSELVSGIFRTVGQVRMIHVRNCSNVRDLGGWPTQYGVPVMYGRLFRSASLERMNSNGRHDFVENLDVTAELDLRHEVNRTTSCLGADMDYLRLRHDPSLRSLTQKNPVYAKDLRWIIDRLREGQNVDFHCAIGCDRTGTLAFLIEGLLGLSELDLCRDFELSTLSLSTKNKRQRATLSGMIAHVRKFGKPNDLAGCFYNYWLSLGMKREELDFFIGEMLGIPDFENPEEDIEPTTYEQQYFED
ncbi:MAG: tyrosine-protein phosphatase [Bacteroidaceae bacterium]|nr:tyrosine-protein phosphatase [Bacteroidaceae bacterium]